MSGLSWSDIVQGQKLAHRTSLRVQLRATRDELAGREEMKAKTEARIALLREREAALSAELNGAEPHRDVDAEYEAMREALAMDGE